MKKIILILFVFIITFNNILAISLNSNVSLVTDINTDKILFEKEKEKIIYPASTTKVLTCILAIENLDLNKKIKISKEHMDLIPYNSSIMGLKANDYVSVKDLLYGLMMLSGNDAAIVFAYEISGNIENFSILMNKKAKEIGCTNSNFTNPHGYFNKMHYSTAKDMTKIFKYAYQYEIFKNIIKSDYYTPEYTEFHKEFKSTNPFLYKNNLYNIYGKTGFVDESGSVFIGISNYNNISFIICVYDGINNNKYNEKTPDDLNNLCKYIYNDLVFIDKINKSDIKIKYIDKKLNIEKVYSLEKSIDSYYGKKRINYNLKNLEITSNYNTIKITDKLNINDFIQNMLSTLFK